MICKVIKEFPTFSKTYKVGEYIEVNDMLLNMYKDYIEPQENVNEKYNSKLLNREERRKLKKENRIRRLR